jgi:hypothetical protein
MIFIVRELVSCIPSCNLISPPDLQNIWNAVSSVSSSEITPRRELKQV